MSAITVGGYFVIVASILLFIITLLMVLKIGLRRGWQALGFPVEMGFYGLLFVFWSRNQMDVCTGLILVLGIQWISRRLRFLQSFIQAAHQYDELWKQAPR